MKKMILFGIASIFFCTIAISQVTIQGTVTDEISPLEWANIYIKNSTTGTTSGKAGNFTLDVKKGDTIIVSYTGYQTKEITINDQTYIPITLENESLDEVVVTGYSVTKKTIILCGDRVLCVDRGYRTIPSMTLHCTAQGILINSKDNTETISPSLFPNPSLGGVFNIKMIHPYKEVHIMVTNLLGQNVQSRTLQNTNSSITLNLTSVKTGVYLINMVADGERLPTQKAIRG